jgi:hypothetical protein
VVDLFGPLRRNDLLQGLDSFGKGFQGQVVLCRLLQILEQTPPILLRQVHFLETVSWLFHAPRSFRQRSRAATRLPSPGLPLEKVRNESCRREVDLTLTSEDDEMRETSKSRSTPLLPWRLDSSRLQSESRDTQKDTIT